jgi:hypothetical protein
MAPPEAHVVMILTFGAARVSLDQLSELIVGKILPFLAVGFVQRTIEGGGVDPLVASLRSSSGTRDHDGPDEVITMAGMRGYQRI